MNHDGRTAQLFELLEARCARTNRVEQDRLLEALLLSRPELRRLYLRFLFMHAMLEELLGGPQPPAVQSPLSLPPKTPARSPILGFLAEFMGGRAGPRGAVFTWGLALLVNCVLVGLVVLAIAPRFRERVADGLAGAARPEPAAIPKGAVARLISGVDCRWQGTAPAVGDALERGSLRLAAGSAEIELDQGARLRIVGPSDFELCDSAHVFLGFGQLRASVPRQAIGFTVATETVTVVDLGTEFGVVADKRGQAEIRVFRGLVSVQPVATPAGTPPAFVLRAGEMKRIDAPRNANSATIAIGEPPAPPAAAPADQLPPGLLAYWSFDDSREPVGDRSIVRAGDLDRKQLARGLVGAGAARFAPGRLERAAPRPDGFRLADAVSIEAVFVSSWSGKFHDYDFIFRKQAQGATRLLLALENDEQDDVDGPALGFEVVTAAGLKSLHLPLDGRMGRPSLGEITDGRPHYVAATFDGRAGRMAIYVDGARRMSRLIESGLSLRLLRGQAAPRGEKFGDSHDPFSGVLDEIAVYRTVLSSGEIAEHWESVRRGRGYFDKP